MAYQEESPAFSEDDDIREYYDSQTISIQEEDKLIKKYSLSFILDLFDKTNLVHDIIFRWVHNPSTFKLGFNPKPSQNSYLIGSIADEIYKYQPSFIIRTAREMGFIDESFKFDIPPELDSYVVLSDISSHHDHGD